MRSIKYHRRKKQKVVIWLPVILFVLLTLVIVWVQHQFKDEKRFAVVTLHGDGTAINLSKNYNFTEFTYGVKGRGAFLAEKGDVLGMNDNVIHFKNTRSDSLQVNDEGDSLLFINGKVNNIIISGEEKLLPWFRTMNAETLSGLQSVTFNSAITPGYIPFLKVIARLKPRVNICFNNEDSLNLLSAYIKQADFFDPAFIKASVTQNEVSLLDHWKNTECLYLEILDSLVTVSLPAMPALKQCILFGDELKQIPGAFFSKNAQLEKLTLITAFDNYEALRPLNKLTELSINNPCDSANFTALNSKLANLSVFSISGNYDNISAIASLNKLRWLGLPENTSQQQFNTIAAQLHNLQVLQITGSNSITNLAALKSMANLKGLVITDTVTDKQSLYSLKELRYLSVPGHNKKDSTYLLALQKALPGCIVVPNSGACLGSGWLLMLVPLALLFALLRKQYYLKRVSNEAL